MAATAPDIGSFWHYPKWTAKNWQGPWRVVRVGAPIDQASEIAGEAVVLERVDGPPEAWWGDALIDRALDRWPGGWEPWPVVPDFPPSGC